MGGLLSRPVAWVVALLLIAAGVVLMWPAGLGLEPEATDPAGVGSSETPLPLPSPIDAGTPETAAADVDAAASPPLATAPPAPEASARVDAPATPAADASTVPPRADASPGAPPATATTAVTAVTAVTAASPLLEIRAVADSWVEVRDAAGQVLVSRTLAAGETLPLDPALPARLTTGNVAGTEVRLRGERVDLSVEQRGNIARLELR